MFSALLNLTRAYVGETWPFALAHLFLALCCFYIWLTEFRRFNAERLALESANEAGMNPERSTICGDLLAFAYLLADKGQLVEFPTVSQQLKDRTAPFDHAFTVCVNGFVVIGIAGTLFSLWQFGPAFWKQLLDTSSSSATAPTNVAFAASFFGLLLAFGFTVVDATVFRPMRDRFIATAAAKIVESAAEKSPLSSEAAIQQASKDFQLVVSRALQDLKEAQGQANERFLGTLGKFVSDTEARHREIANTHDRAVQNATSAFVGAVARLTDHLEGLKQQHTTVSQSFASTASKAVADISLITSTHKDALTTLSSEAASSISAARDAIVSELSTGARNLRGAATRATISIDGAATQLTKKLADANSGVIASTERVITAAKRAEEALGRIQDRERSPSGHIVTNPRYVVDDTPGSAGRTKAGWIGWLPWRR